ncbi:MAG: ATP-binding protein [Bacteroidota bacterium]
MSHSWITRNFEKQIFYRLEKGTVLALYGPRRVGKTSLIKRIIASFRGKVFEGEGDDIDLRSILSSAKKSLILSSFSGYDLVFIDEAQRIPQIGWGLKILIDHNPDLRIIVTGSSSFELSGQISSPLTGRSWTLLLHPMAISELSSWKGTMDIRQKLQEYLIFGCYPEVVLTEIRQKKIDYLIELRNAYLFKDILELENIQNASKLTDLLKLLAFQIGNEVSLNELSNSLGVAKQTVERYVDLLEKTFIIKKLNGFSRNLRKEITKTSRYYFLDNGVRNALINNFNQPDSRNDMGQLWENFCFSERLKVQQTEPIHANNYFWRTYDQQEIDLIEERDGTLFAFEFKWNSRKKVKVPIAWKKAYPDSTFKSVNTENFLEFLM